MGEPLTGWRRVGAAVVTSAWLAILPIAGPTAGFDPLPWVVAGAVVGLGLGWWVAGRD